MGTVGPPPRPQLAAFRPYVAGRDAATVKRLYRLRRVVKLASNENPLGPSPRAVAALRRTAPGVHRYPDSLNTSLRQALADHLRLSPDRVTVGAGSDEIIESVAKAFLGPGDEIVVSQHAFIRYRMAGELMGARVVTVPARHLGHDLTAMARAVTPRTKAVFIANPNNPTGTYAPRADLQRFLAALPSRVAPVIDEAYFEFARSRPDYPDAVALLRAGRPLLALRTFSKAYGLAGLRVGYAAGPAAWIDILERVRPPFNLSLPAQSAAVEALKDKTHVARVSRLVETERARLADSLNRLGAPAAPSVANFLLIDVSPRRGAEVFEALLRRGVIVRAMDEYGLPRHIRVTIGRPAENRAFLAAFTQARKIP